MEETRVIYYTEDEQLPYSVKLKVAPQDACLRDIKKIVNGRNYKFYIQNLIPDIGPVKEEISEDDAKLPIVNGYVCLWLVSNDRNLSSGQSKSQTSHNELDNRSNDNNPNPFSSMNSVATSGSTGSSSTGNIENKNKITSSVSNPSQGNHRKSKSSYDSLTRKSSQHRQTTANTPLKDLNFDETSTETESLVNEFNGLRVMNQNKVQHNAKRNHFNSFNSHQNGHHRHQQQVPVVRGGSLGGHHHHHGHHPYHNPVKSGNIMIPARSNKQFDTVSMLSDHDTTTFFDSDAGQSVYDDDDDDDDHFSSITGSTATAATSVLSKREKRRKMNRYLPSSRGGGNFLKRNNSMLSSMSSLADSTLSLNIITVTLNLDTVNFLGISIVGQSNKTGEGGIYVGSIMEGGAVALDGRIEPGDMILQVNDVSFEHMSNDDAVRVLREAVMKPGPVRLVVAKCWDLNPKGYFQLSKQDPIYPINPSAWVAHTQAAINGNKIPQTTSGRPHPFHMNQSVSSFGSTASFSTTFADSTITTVNGFGNYQHQNRNHNNHYGGPVNQQTVLTSDSTRFGCTQELNLTADSDMELIMRTMAAPDSGLDIRERHWLKITIPDAFIGRDIVDWLFNHVEGFPEKRDAHKYASMMLKNGYIRSAVNRPKFSERSYYVFGDQTTFITQNGTQGGGTLFTVDEEREDDFDSVSEYDRDSNNYAPMSFPQPQAPSIGSSQPPGLTFGPPPTSLHSHQPKIYSNVVVGGIGGPGSSGDMNPPNYHSSSSSNVTSNSTSTTSQNTTATTSNSQIGIKIRSFNLFNSF